MQEEILPTGCLWWYETTFCWLWFGWSSGCCISDRIITSSSGYQDGNPKSQQNIVWNHESPCTLVFWAWIVTRVIFSDGQGSTVLMSKNGGKSGRTRGKILPLGRTHSHVRQPRGEQCHLWNLTALGGVAPRCQESRPSYSRSHFSSYKLIFQLINFATFFWPLGAISCSRK